jgi:hypothetical protein
MFGSLKVSTRNRSEVTIKKKIVFVCFVIIELSPLYVHESKTMKTICYIKDTWKLLCPYFSNFIF